MRTERCLTKGNSSPVTLALVGSRTAVSVFRQYLADKAADGKKLSAHLKKTVHLRKSSQKYRYTHRYTFKH